MEELFTLLMDKSRSGELKWEAIVKPEAGTRGYFIGFGDYRAEAVLQPEGPPMVVTLNLLPAQEPSDIEAAIKYLEAMKMEAAA